MLWLPVVPVDYRTNTIFYLRDVPVPVRYFPGRKDADLSRNNARHVFRSLYTVLRSGYREPFDVSPWYIVNYS